MSDSSLSSDPNYGYVYKIYLVLKSVLTYDKLSGV
jgi:hypothetical protein